MPLFDPAFEDYVARCCQTARAVLPGCLCGPGCDCACADCGCEAWGEEYDVG